MLKTLSRFLVPGFLITSTVFGVELHLATNEQILGELSQRLNTGAPSPNAIATFICDSNYLKISLVGHVTGSAKLYIGDQAKCLEQATPLNKNKSKVYTLTIAAACDSNYLKRYAFYASGDLKELDSTYIGDYTQCMVQAKALNEG